jgi:hypothetical protein
MPIGAQPHRRLIFFRKVWNKNHRKTWISISAKKPGTIPNEYFTAALLPG